MRALLQRVSEASVTIAGETVARIDAGLLVLLGIFPSDGTAEIDYLVYKVLGLRIFADGDKRWGLEGGGGGAPQGLGLTGSSPKAQNCCDCCCCCCCCCLF